MGRFKPRELRNDASQDEIRRQLNEIQKEIASDLTALAATRATTAIQIGDYTARYGDVVRMAPPVTGAHLILPPVNLAQPNARVTVILVAAVGALTAEAVDATVNGLATLPFLAGLGVVEFTLTPDGWFAWSQSVSIDWVTLAGAGLSYAAGVLSVTGSTSITVTGDQVQRAALTNEVTAPANSNATTVTRATDFQAAPWTGPHQFNGEVRDGTLHTEASATGALNITLTAGATRVLISSTGDVTLGTISGCADGRRLLVEHERASGSGILTVTHGTGTNAISLPSSQAFMFANRDGFVLEGRGTTWKVAGMSTALHPTGLQPEATVTAGNEIVPYTIRVPFTAAAAGTADDVTIYNANATQSFRIVLAQLRVSTAVALSTATLRTASGGLGSVVMPDAATGALTWSSATAGNFFDSAGGTSSVTAAGSLFLRRSDRGIAGQVILWCRPI